MLSLNVENFVFTPGVEALRLGVQHTTNCNQCDIPKTRWPSEKPETWKLCFWGCYTRSSLSWAAPSSLEASIPTRILD